jgi:DNA-binding CsgD family transcriptional regulator
LDLGRLYEQLDRLFASQDFAEDELDYAVLARHVRALEQLDAMTSGALSIFDLFRREHAYMGRRFATTFGWDFERCEAEGPHYGDARLHPDDRLRLMQAGLHFTAQALARPPVERKDFKLFAEYRVKGLRNDYVRVIEQQSVLELDRRGNIWLALSVLDLAPEPELDAPFRCRLHNWRTGDLFTFPPPEESGGDLLTLREREILQLVSKGLVSREIADVLYISVHTVNTHRQRIIRKLDVSNTSEAIRYALDLGILEDGN